MEEDANERLKFAKSLKNFVGFAETIFVDETLLAL